MPTTPMRPMSFVEGAYIAAASGFIPIAVAIGMSIWRARDAETAATYGSARWAVPSEIRAAGLTAPAGVVLGRYERDYLRHDGPEHLLCFAPTPIRQGYWSSCAGASDLARQLHCPRHEGRELDPDGRLLGQARPRVAVRCK